MKKKIISLLLTTTMVATLVVGCGSKSNDGTTDAVSSDGDEVITITSWGWDSGYTDVMFKSYEETHPNVHFEPVAVEHGDMLTKVQQALASGSELPTFIFLDNIYIENWKEMDIFVDLKEYGFDTSNYVEDLANQSVTESGEVMGAQLNVCPSGIAYKRDLAKEYFGTDDPDELFQIFNSYDAYVEKGAEVYEKSNGKVHLFHSAQAVAEWLYFASDIANMDGDTLNYTDKMTDIMSVLVKLRDANALDSYQNGTPEANATYADDAHIFYPCPNWSPAYYIMGNDPEGAGNWGLMHAPVDYNHGGGALGISNTATEEQKQAAYDFIIWATEGEGAAIARDNLGYVTPYKPLMEDSEWITCGEELKAFFGGEDIISLYYQEIAPNITLASPSKWDESMINVRSDLAQLAADDKDMDLDTLMQTGKEQITQLVTDGSVTIK